MTAMFFVGFFFFPESKSGPPKEHSYQITMKYIEPLWGRRIFKVSLYNAIVKISPAHGGHVFCWIKISKRNLKEVHPRNIPTKLQWNPSSHYGEEEFLKFHYMLYCENKPRPRRPCFLLDHNFFNESKRTSPKEHSYQITIKSIEPLWRKRILKISLYAI